MPEAIARPRASGLTAEIMSFAARRSVESCQRFAPWHGAQSVKDTAVSCSVSGAHRGNSRRVNFAHSIGELATVADICIVGAEPDTVAR
ncbi:hypothetical protein J6590_027339 [Homalodisca vitripennis]|nr:hypothetical protein J6590_027339 [Homalodisca vitripennis]